MFILCVRMLAMAKKSKKSASEEKVIEFVLDDNAPVSSTESSKKTPVTPVKNPEPKKAAVKVDAAVSSKKTPAKPVEQEEPKKSAVKVEPAARSRVEEAREAPEVVPRRESRVFKELELPKLPILEKQDRAVLQVQSPNRVFFYWSLKANPFQTLKRTLGAEASAYTLALRLLDLQSEAEELHAIEPEGSWWFNTDAGRTYRAEIGFYSTSRPFVRILFSNTVTTPRKAPSRRAADESEWRVTPDKFAEVLDVTGFSRDAFDVALTGDDAAATDRLTQVAFAEFTGETGRSIESISTEDIRFAMLAIASGRPLEEIRWKIGAALFAVLQAKTERLTPKNAAAILSEFFEIDEMDFEEQETAPTVFGASLVHFPKTFRTRRDYSPVSSHTIR